MKRTFAAVLFAAMFATTAHAQPDGRVSIGAGLGFHDYRDSAFPKGSWSVVPEYNLRWSHGDRQGLSFGLKGGITYSQPSRDDFIGGLQTKTGDLRMVSALVGAGPTYRTGPFSISTGVVAGPSFNSFSVDDAARAAYSDRLGATLNSIKVKNSMVVRPTLGLWYDLSSRWALHSSVDYTVNRPMVTTTVDGETNSSRWMLDKWGYQAGVAFGLF